MIFFSLEKYGCSGVTAINGIIGIKGVISPINGGSTSLENQIQHRCLKGHLHCQKLKQLKIPTLLTVIIVMKFYALSLHTYSFYIYPSHLIKGLGLLREELHI